MKLCFRALIASLALALSLVCAPPALSASSSTQLYLEVAVNRVPVDGLVKAYVKNEAVWVDRESAEQLGLNLEAVDRLWQKGLVELASLPGAKVSYLPQLLSLTVELPPKLLANRSEFRNEISSDAVLSDAQAEGIVLNYNLNFHHSKSSLDRATALSAWTEVRVPSARGAFSSTALSHWSESRTAGESQVRHTRLDTYWRSDFLRSSNTLVIGDTTTSSLSWSRPVRIGGLRFGKDFGLHPYRPTSPLTTLEGQVNLPSTVDVYVGGLLQQQLQVMPGTYSIDALTAVDGAGMASLVITDINGQRRTVDVPIYGTLSLLKHGLTDWSVEVGSRRRRYGLDSFDYDGSMLTNATVRHGWSNALTLEAHSEWSGGTRVLGVGGLVRLGVQGGILSSSIAASNSSQYGAGEELNVGYQWTVRPWRFSIQSQRTSPKYRDISLLDAGAYLRRSDRVFLGYSQQNWDFGATVFGQVDNKFRQSQVTSLSASRQLGNGARISVAYTEVQADLKDQRVTVSLLVPLGRKMMASVSATQRSERGSTLGWQLSKSAQAADEWSWRVAQGTPGGWAQFNASRTTSAGQWIGSIDKVASMDGVGGATSVSSSFNGAIALINRRVFATRTVDNAFALVSTAGLAGIPVRLENQLVGETDERGQLLVTPLNAMQRNQLSVDVLDLEYDISASTTTMVATPRRYSGVLVDFAFQRVTSVRARLVDRSGEPLPTGSLVAADAGNRLGTYGRMSVFPRVGRDGEVSIENPVTGAILRVQLDQGKALCEAVMPPVSERGSGPIYLGEITCSP